jgi:DNA-binding beta-propeller fold protein YncE
MKTMMTIRPVFSFLFLLFPFLYPVCAQNPVEAAANLLNKPKDIVYDPVSRYTYISNYGGDAIVRMDSLGNQEFMLQGINSPMGLHLCNDTLIITSNSPSVITAIDVATNSILYEIPVTGAQYLAMMDMDPRTGLIYIVEQPGAVYKLNYREAWCSVFVPVSSGIFYGSQTLEVDTVNDRLLVFKWDPGYIRAVSLGDSTDVTNAVNQRLSQIQSSQRGPEGEIYVSSYINDAVYRYESNLTGYPSVLVSGLGHPSGIAYNPHHNTLFVCNYGSNSVSEIPLIPTLIRDPANPQMELSIYPNPADDKCTIMIPGKPQKEITLRITDHNGRHIQSLPVHYTRDNSTMKLITREMDNGAYTVQFMENYTPVASGRLMIVH